MFEAKVTCPRCGRTWIIPQAQDGIECICHLYCDEGTQPSDCSMTYPCKYTGSLAWPMGSHQDSADEGDDVLNRAGYCSTHNKYTYKVAIWLEVNWEEWYEKRLRPQQRLMKQ